MLVAAFLRRIHSPAQPHILSQSFSRLATTPPQPPATMLPARSLPCRPAHCTSAPLNPSMPRLHRSLSLPSPPQAHTIPTKPRSPTQPLTTLRPAPRCFIAAPDRPAGPRSEPHPPPTPSAAAAPHAAPHPDHPHTPPARGIASSAAPSASGSCQEAAVLPAGTSSSDALRLDVMLLERAATSRARGRIEVIVGPMFAGKSTELLKRARAAAEESQRVAYVKSCRDTRYAAREVVTHDGQREPCYALERLMDLPAAAGDEAFAAFEVIAIDEAQFFPDLLEFCCHAADLHHKTLYVAGLDGDFRRQRFGAVLDLVPMADAVHKLASSCSECGQPAPFTVRTTRDAAQEVVGGSEAYRPMCRAHYALFTADSRPL